MTATSNPRFDREYCAGKLLVDAAIMMIPVGILASTLYRKTKNFYLPAVFNAMFFTWMSVATDLIYIGA